MSINISIRELDAAKSHLADAQRRLGELRDRDAARQMAAADLAGALARHRDLLQQADLGLADKKQVQEARDEIHALRAEAAKPDVGAELAEVEAEVQRLKDANSAAFMAVVRDMGEAVLARYHTAVAELADADAQLEGIRLASLNDPERLGNLVASILTQKGSTYDKAEAFRLAGAKSAINYDAEDDNDPYLLIDKSWEEVKEEICEAVKACKTLKS